MSTRRTHEYDPNKLTSLSVQLPNQFTQIVHEAAAKLGVSAAMYVGQAALDRACDELGKPRLDVTLIKAVSSVARHGSIDANAFIRATSKQLQSRVEESPTENDARTVLRTYEAFIEQRFAKPKAAPTPKKGSSVSGEYESASFRAAPKVGAPSSRRK
jgi:hypothetical protein